MERNCIINAQHHNVLHVWNGEKYLCVIQLLLQNNSTLCDTFVGEHSFTFYSYSSIYNKKKRTRVISH